MCNALARAHLLCPVTRAGEKFRSEVPSRLPVQKTVHSPPLRGCEYLLPAHANRSQIRLRMVLVGSNITSEARDCAAKAGAEQMLPLILVYESRTTLDLRALTNMRGGRLKKHHEESGEYHRCRCDT